MGMKTNSAKTPIEKAAEQDAVPPGYKRTDVSLIPVDWKVKALNDLGSFIKGKGIKRDDVTDDGLACIRYGELYTRYNNYIDSPASRIPESVARTSQPLQTGDLLFAGSGETAEEIGKCVAYLGEEEAYAGGDIVILRPVGQNSLYLGHLLNHPVVAEQKARYGQGDAVVHISARNLAMVKLPLPPTKKEQEAIAEALSDVDGLIAALDKLIAKKRAIKQAAMQQLLTGKTRLPGFSGEWEMRPFATSLFRLNVKQHQIFARDYQPFGKYPVIDQGQAPVVGFTDRSDKLFVCPSGGVIVFGDHTCIVKFIDNNFVIGADGTQILVTQDEQCARFYAYLLQHDRVEPTGYNRHFRILRERSFRVPLPPEQNAIAKVLSDMDAEIEALEQRRAKTQQIKQGMMQQLLTGRVRLV